MKYLKIVLLILLTCAFMENTHAQSLWKDIEESKIQKGTRYITPEKFKTYALDEDDLKQVLAAAPLEETAAARLNPTYFSMPMPDGTMKVFEIVNSPVMASELAARYPEIQTYAGYDIDNPTNTARFDLTPKGFHAMIFTQKFGTVYIDPYSFDKKGHYMVYKRKDARSTIPEDFKCGVVDDPNHDHHKSLKSQPLLGDCTRRTYRIAIAATGEYTGFYQDDDNDDTDSIENALAAQTTTMNRVNAIYMRDLAVFMQIVANNDAIIYTNAATDPYTNNNTRTMLDEVQDDIDDNIGNNNYDIGHVFGTAGGGVAFVGTTCESGAKAEGVSSSSSPLGDDFVLLVAHEIGHQFGANHSYNNECGFGGEPNRNDATAYEPGTGNTIMGYAATGCLPTTQPANDDYFHIASLEEMTTRILATTCATTTPLNNNAPTITNVPTNLTIPGGTPFELTATAADADQDALTYCWEQFDNEISTQPPLATATNGPNFRSTPPTNNPTRYFPNLQAVIEGDNPEWEVLSTVDRTYNFRVTVRDNAMGGGCSFYENAVINVDGDSGPFLVQNPNDNGINWAANSTQNVTWDVAGTNNAPVSCTNVNILLSLDGGQTYPITLATNTPNDGTENIQVPNNPTATARVKIICSDNVFYDISDNDFTINQNNELNITCLADAIVGCVADIVPGTATLQTNCTNGGANVALTGPVINGEPDCPGTTYTYTYTGTDNCGAQESCTRTFTIQNDPPTITCPANQTVACEADINIGTPTFLTNCGTQGTLTQTGPVVNGDPNSNGTTYTYTHTVTDACGRTASCQQVFTIDDECEQIDFNNLPAGTIVSNQYPGITISTQDNFNRPAMIFDTGNPTSNDFDLGTPNQIFGGPGVGTGFGNTDFQGNALVVSKNRNIPNETEGQLIFEFDTLVFIRNMDFLDMECNDNTVELYDDNNNLIEEIDLPDYGENSFHTEQINVSGVSRMVVNFPCAGGGITNLNYCTNDTSDACGTCEESVLNFDNTNWQNNATNGTFVTDNQSFSVNINDNDNILQSTRENEAGLKISINPNSVNDEVTITYALSQVTNRVVFDIVDLDRKTGSSAQQEAVCVYGLLGTSQIQIMPTITSLNGSVAINGNCAEATANSSASGEDESVLVAFAECIDQVIIQYGTGNNSQTNNPAHSSISIGQNLGFSTEVCQNACTAEAVDCGTEGDDDNDSVCNSQDVCPNGDDNIDADEDGIPDACDTDVDCDRSLLDFSEDGFNWQTRATSGNFTADGQTYNINIADNDNILQHTAEYNSGIRIAINPNNTNDEVVMTYQLSSASDNVVFDIVDLDRKTGNSPQQEAVCVYGLLGNDATQILPVITSLDGSVAINGNCAEATTSSSFGDDESILVTFTECIDRIVIEYGTGNNSPTNNPASSSIRIGQNLGFSSSVCDTPCAGSSQLKEETTPNINLYPNPVYGNTVTIEVDAEVSGNVQLVLVDALGRAALAENIVLANDSTYQMGVEQLSPGIYFVQLQTNEWRTAAMKLVVVKP